ncbi:hypothetical protein DMC61_33715 [Amycolatopsis sp. WAC 04169]|nr:hypothetical protein DMC61_33715 [Amycolatopsis sp. WAC 04169]
MSESTGRHCVIVFACPHGDSREVLVADDRVSETNCFVKFLEAKADHEYPTPRTDRTRQAHQRDAELMSPIGYATL